MNFSKPNLNIGVIGSGFMGKTHVYGFAIADRVFDLPYKLNLISIADVNSKVANSAAKKLGFQKSTANWMNLINDKQLDLISITSILPVLYLLTSNPEVFMEKEYIKIFQSNFIKYLDSMQKILDENKISSEVHIIFKIN